MRLFLVPALLLALSATPALAGNWQVEKDGSGDFTVIQDAIDVAAVGDTIRIGPGAYREYSLFPFRDEYESANCFIGIQTDSLVIIGAGPDLVEIGPKLSLIIPPKSIGVAMRSGDADGIHLEGFTVRNVLWGLRLRESVTVRDVVVEDCESGIVHTYGHAMMEAVTVRNCSTVGISMNRVPDSELISCVLVDNPSIGIQFRNSEGLLLENCEIRGNGIGIHASDSGTVRNSTILQNLEYGVWVDAEMFPLFLENSRLESNRISIGGEMFGFVQANGCNIGPADSLLIDMDTDASVRINGCNLHISAMPAVSIDFDLIDSFTGAFVDMRDNWWGGLEDSQIPDAILDQEDDPNRELLVRFLPTRDRSVGTEPRSFGSFKRGR